MKLSARALAALVSAAVATMPGCGTLIYGTTEKIPIASDPPAATVLVDGKPVGQTPLTVALGRKEYHEIKIQKSGYISYKTTTTTAAGSAPYVDIIPAMLFPPLILLVIGEYETGAAYRILPDKIDAHLLAAANATPATSTTAAATPTQGSATPTATASPTAASSAQAISAPSPGATQSVTPSPTASPVAALPAATVSATPTASPTAAPTPVSHD